MLEWLFRKAIGWAFGLVILGLTWPIYKSGFLVRQGFAYQQSINKFDNMIRSSSAQRSATLTPTAEYYTIKRKALAFMVLPSLALFTLFVILLVSGNWKLAAAEMVLAVIGFFNVE